MPDLTPLGAAVEAWFNADETNHPEDVMALALAAAIDTLTDDDKRNVALALRLTGIPGMIAALKRAMGVG